MRFQLATVACFLMFFPAASAWSLDCRKADQPVDQLICETPRLKALDAEMNKAYFSLLRRVTDADMHAALIFSQQRWIKERYRRGPDDANGDSDEHERQVRMLTDEMKDRLATLQMKEKDNPKTSAVVAQMLEEKQFVWPYSGGAFQGYWSDCEFFPDGDSAYYECYAMEALQNGNRVCSDYSYWASGRIYEFRKVAEVQDGKPKAIAGCGTENGAENETCPELGDQSIVDFAKSGYGWNFHIEDSDERYNPDLRMFPKTKLDPDLDVHHALDDRKSDWMAQCLTTADYPPRSLESPATKQ
ncbi:MAG: DUF1311 domain-containing protein [Rhizobiaceae bacterium]|nr:DUF1311 domain-containing protein [Rhizobiaceae bacterium]